MSQTLVQAFQEDVKRHPDAIALHYFEDSWTYARLARDVGALAGALNNMGVGSKDVVAVMLQNMPACVVSYLAIWAVGASVVPLNIMFQPAELAQHLGDARVTTLIILGSVASRLQALPDSIHLKAVVVVDDRQDLVGVAPAWLPAGNETAPGGTHDYAVLLKHPPLAIERWYRGRSDDLALLTYTSGTTGVAKGAMNTHGQILHNVGIYRELAELTSDDVNIAFAPLFHITGAVAGLAVSVVLGIPLILLYRYEPGVALEALVRHHVTFTVGAVTTYLALLQQPDIDACDLSRFNHAYSGGAPVPRATVDAFEARTGVYIHNVYGLTESANGLIMVPSAYRAPTDAESGALSIGRPGPGVEISIRDLENPGRVVEVGQLGELALQGPSIIRGYWNRPDANQESFCEGWFLTGDVARRDEEGWIYLVDRKKDMIISAGNKVWPRDVEDVLYQHPGVREAVVVGVADSYRGEVVTAFVVRHADAADLTTEALLGFVRERLAAYKVPRRIEWVDSIPQTPTGKFLRRAFRSNS